MYNWRHFSNLENEVVLNDDSEVPSKDISREDLQFLYQKNPGQDKLKLYSS